MLTFNLVGASRLVQAVALGEYHKYWIDREQGVRNPQFDQSHSGRILSLKSPQHAQHKMSVKHFGNLVVSYLEASRMSAPLEIVVVPSSTAGSVGPGLAGIADHVVRGMNGVSYRHGALRRTKTITKLSAGGNRNLDVHRNTLAFTPNSRPGLAAPVWTLVIDDVSTTGNSLIASVDKIAFCYPYTKIGVLVLGKTVHD